MESCNYSKSNEAWEPKNSEEDVDEIDEAPDNFQMTTLGFIFLFSSIILYLIDLGTDAHAAYYYYQNKDYSYFASTVAVNLIASIIITFISVRMYVADREEKNSSRKFRCRIAICFLGIIFQTALLIRQIDALKYAIKSAMARSRGDRKKQKKNFIKKLHEEADLAWLKVFECYIESAPTVVLQVSFILLDYNNFSDSPYYLRSIILFTNFVAMGLSMVIYHRCIRFDQENKKNISCFGVFIQFLWHTNFTVSRILSLSALVSIFPLWAGVASVLHWCGMTIWVATTAKTSFCGSNFILEIFFAGAVGLVYIFNFFSLKDKPTRKYYSIFYGLFFIQNVTICVIWGVYSFNLFSRWLYYLFLLLPPLTFAVAVSCAIFYYTVLHPNIIKQSSKNKEVFYEYPFATNT